MSSDGTSYSVEYYTESWEDGVEGVWLSVAGELDTEADAREIAETQAKYSRQVRVVQIVTRVTDVYKDGVAQ